MDVFFISREVTLEYSDLCDLCGLSAQLLSDLKPLKQHRKFSNPGKVILFILCHWQHPINKMIFICYRAALTDLNPASNTNELINPDEW